MGRPTTEEDVSSDHYSIPKDREKPQSFGANLTRQKNLLTQPWNQSSQRTPPFCPTTSKNAQVGNTQMSKSTIGFIAHALCPSTTSTETQHQNNQGNSLQTVTGNSYSIFTTKNYGDNEMHWFLMVLIWALLLFAWWKLRSTASSQARQSRNARTSSRQNRTGVSSRKSRRRSTATRGSWRTSGA